MELSHNCAGLLYIDTCAPKTVNQCSSALLGVNMKLTIYAVYRNGKMTMGSSVYDVTQVRTITIFDLPPPLSHVLLLKP